MKNNNDPTYNYHQFRLFSYLSISILSVFVILELFIVLQHIEEEESANTFIANQETLLENQNYLKNITNGLQSHEFAEMSILEERKEISLNNSEKLDQVLEILEREGLR